LPNRAEFQRLMRDAEGELMTFMNVRFAQQYRDQVRKHTRDAMRQKAEAGYVIGGKGLGYDNVRVAEGKV
jgi:DNA invertase Pin-like site-specific DNA recombinase